MPATNTRTVVLVAGGIGALLGVVYLAAQERPNRPIGEAEQQARCTTQQYACPGYTPPGSVFRPEDGPPYAPLVVVGLKCLNDAGVPYRALPTLNTERYVDPMLCTEFGDAGLFAEPLADPVGTTTPGCACKTGRDCFVRLEDGGFGPAPWAETLPYQGFTGSNCFPKVCGEIAGLSSWPSECPNKEDGGFEF